MFKDIKDKLLQTWRKDRELERWWREHKPFPLRALFGLGTVMLVVGMSLFVTYSFRAKISQVGPARMEIPCAIYGRTQLYMAGEKLYLFCEGANAVNVYDLDGNFLFCTQISWFSNGISSLAMWGEEMYITSRDHKLFRFDRDGNCLGWAEDGWVYDREGNRTAFQYNWTPLYFDEKSVCYHTRVGEKREHAYVYKTTAGTYRLQAETEAEVIRMLGGSYVDYGKTVTYGDVVYGVSLNKFYKIENGQKEILTKTPLMQWYLQSPILEWLSAAAGGLLCNLASKTEKKSKKRRAKKVQS